MQCSRDDKGGAEGRIMCHLLHFPDEGLRPIQEINVEFLDQRFCPGSIVLVWPLYILCLPLI